MIAVAILGALLAMVAGVIGVGFRALIFNVNRVITESNHVF